MRNWSNIAVVNLERKQVEIEIRKRQVKDIQDLTLLGSKETQIVSSTSQGLISLFSVNYGLRKICSDSSYQVQI